MVTELLLSPATLAPPGLTMLSCVPPRLDEKVTDPLSLSLFAVRMKSSIFVFIADRSWMLAGPVSANPGTSAAALSIREAWYSAGFTVL